MAPRAMCAALAAVVAAVVLAGCSQSTPGTGQSGPSGSAPPTLSSGAPKPDAGANRGTVDAATVRADADTAVAIVNDYWLRHWQDFFTGSYTPPNVLGLYDESNAPSCGGQKEPADNAFYCQPGDFLAFGAPLLARGYQLGTNTLTYLVVAHEWGHAVQGRLSKELWTPAAELQADCFAGAVLYGAAKDGTLQFEPGDEKAIVTALTQLADETGWTSTSDHGDAFQRIESFDLGRSNGVAACLPTSTPSS